MVKNWYNSHVARLFCACCPNSVSVQEDNTVVEGLIWDLSALLSLRVDVRRLRITQKSTEITRFGAYFPLYTDANHIRNQSKGSH